MCRIAGVEPTSVSKNGWEYQTQLDDSMDIMIQLSQLKNLFYGRARELAAYASWHNITPAIKIDIYSVNDYTPCMSIEPDIVDFATQLGATITLNFHANHLGLIKHPNLDKVVFKSTKNVDDW